MRCNTKWPVVYGILGVVLLGILGCGTGGPKTYPIQGNVTLQGSEVALLAGSHVEAALLSDPTLRASGVIEPDGTFRLETRHAGAVVPGAREGKYSVRIVLSDDDRNILKQAARAVAPRFFDFKTSGLTLDVPATGSVVLALASR